MSRAPLPPFTIVTRSRAARLRQTPPSPSPVMDDNPFAVLTADGLDGAASDPVQLLDGEAATGMDLDQAESLASPLNEQSDSYAGPDASAVAPSSSGSSMDLDPIVSSPPACVEPALPVRIEHTPPAGVEPVRSGQDVALPVRIELDSASSPLSSLTSSLDVAVPAGNEPAAAPSPVTVFDSTDGALPVGIELAPVSLAEGTARAYRVMDVDSREFIPSPSPPASPLLSAFHSPHRPVSPLALDVSASDSFASMFNDALVERGASPLEISTPATSSTTSELREEFHRLFSLIPDLPPLDEMPELYSPSTSDSDGGPEEPAPPLNSPRSATPCTDYTDVDLYWDMPGLISVTPTDSSDDGHVAASLAEESDDDMDIGDGADSVLLALSSEHAVSSTPAPRVRQVFIDDYVIESPPWATADDAVASIDRVLADTDEITAF